MAEPLLMSHYHESVIASLKKLSWVKEADSYPQITAQLNTPAVYLAVDEWETAATSDGQLRVLITASLYVVVDRLAQTAEKPAIKLRAAAADLTQWIEGQQFGLDNVEPATFKKASEGILDPNMNDYLVWRIIFEQGVTFGVDPFASTGVPIQGVWLGSKPNIGEQHIADYRLIYEGKGDGRADR